ncbi:hypothetical protein HPB47_012923 [Ixodes persulcatus]|uniref:Uncharacterized protein n=1 Tax=Ixodes persulcatus TaxID=34615 RepID=A0AC60NSD6_IXOPE|nr:hypothetical protein HPB47_012923 [Ixodes persulcatus]
MGTREVREHTCKRGTRNTVESKKVVLRFPPHVLAAVKNKNVLSLVVGSASNLAIGRGGVTATDTANPLYVGGVPDPGQTRAVESLDQFVGCVRYLQINSKLQNLADSRVHGDVHLNSCPTI